MSVFGGRNVGLRLLFPKFPHYSIPQFLLHVPIILQSLSIIPRNFPINPETKIMAKSFQRTHTHTIHYVHCTVISMKFRLGLGD